MIVSNVVVVEAVSDVFDDDPLKLVTVCNVVIETAVVIVEYVKEEIVAEVEMAEDAVPVIFDVDELVELEVELKEFTELRMVDDELDAVDDTV